MSPATPAQKRQEIQSPYKTVNRPHFRLTLATIDTDFAELNGLTAGEAFEAFLSGGQSAPGGRGPHRILSTETRFGKIRVRPARHGGLLGALLGDRFARPDRVHREFRLSFRLHSEGLPLPRPVFAGSRRRGPFWTSHFASVEAASACDGLAWMRGQPSPTERSGVGVEIAHALRRLHDAGVLHGDFNLRNLLIEPIPGTGKSQVWLIDFDRARVPSRVTPADRIREWMRLARSIEKLGFEEVLTPRLSAQLLGAYCDGDRALRKAMLRGLRKEQARLTLHRLGWRLLGRGSPENQAVGRAT